MIFFESGSWIYALSIGPQKLLCEGMFYKKFLTPSSFLPLERGRRPANEVGTPDASSQLVMVLILRQEGDAYKKNFIMGISVSLI